MPDESTFSLELFEQFDYCSYGYLYQHHPLIVGKIRRWEYSGHNKELLQQLARVVDAYGIPESRFHSSAPNLQYHHILEYKAKQAKKSKRKCS